MRATDAALLIVSIVIAWSFIRAHRDKTNSFNLIDLLMEGGRLSRIACAFMATLVVTSWVIVKLTIEGKLTEGLFTAYVAAWVAPIVAKLFSGPSATATASSTSTVTTTERA